MPNFEKQQTAVLSKSAQSVQNVLENAGLICKVLELGSSTRTAVEAANSIGCAVGQIAKSLIFKTNQDQSILVIASGVNRIDEKIITKIIGQEIQKANADFVRNITGFAIGGIPPIGHKTKCVFIFIDKNLLAYDDVWAAAGTPNSVFNISTKDLLKITEAKIIDIK